MSTGSRGGVTKILEIVALCLVIVTAVFALWRMTGGGLSGSLGVTPLRGGSKPEPPPPTELVDTSGLWSKGSDTARVGMIVFEDFECPACGMFSRNTLPALEKNLIDTGAVRLIYWHRPLSQHLRAIPAGAAAECAGRQGKFWQMHDVLFSNQSSFSTLDFEAKAIELGVSAGTLTTCLPSGEKTVRDVADASKRFDIRATPTVFVGRFVKPDSLQVAQRWSGVRDAEGVARDIDKVLRAEAVNGK